MELGAESVPCEASLKVSMLMELQLITIILRQLTMALAWSLVVRVDVVRAIASDVRTL